MPPPLTMNTMAQAPRPAQIDTFNIREFVVDEDAAHFNSALWKTIDQSAFVLAQRDALEAFNVAKAMRLSEETAALEAKQRRAVASSSTSVSTSSASGSAAALMEVAHSKPTQSQPVPITRPASDDAAAIALARSWHVDSLQPSLLENKSASTSAMPKLSVSPSSSPPQTSVQLRPHHERKASASASAPIAIAKQPSPSHNLSLSTSLSSSPPVQVFPAVDSHIASHSSFQSRASHSNIIPIVSTSQSQSPPQSHSLSSHRIENRTISKREPEPSSSNSNLSMSPSHSAILSSRPQISDVTNTTTNTKRRRTERQPSTSPNTQFSALAPPIYESKKSTSASASAREVRLGQIMNPTPSVNPAKENVTEPPRPVRRTTTNTVQQVTQQAATIPQPRQTQQQQASEDTHNLFTATRNCQKCGHLVVSPRSQPSQTHTDPFALPFTDLLHLTCTACGTTHCRGCFSVVQCSSQCPGGASCAVRTCCPQVRAVAIFEALSSFDWIYTAEVASITDRQCQPGQAPSKETGGLGGLKQRQAYLKLLISKADKSMRRFEDAFVRTLRVLSSWLSSSADDDDNVHSSVPHLLVASYLPEVMHAFLSNINVRDWVAHSETYTVLLDTLRRMFDSGSGALAGVLTRPLRQVEWSAGIGVVVWEPSASANIIYADTKPNPNISGTTTTTPAGAGAGASPPLSDLVKQLEAHRRPLMALAAKVQFSATVEKVNNLCDGISYLLLQQVVGGI